MNKFCGNCGSAIREGSKFCPNCGESIAQTEPQKPMCARCGAELKEASKFCPKCGQPVGDSAPVAAPVQSTVPQTQSTPTIAPSVPMSQMEQSAAERGIYVAKPKDQNVPTPRPQKQPREKKSADPKKLITALVAVVMAAVLLVTGLISPGWMKGSRTAKVSFPKDDKATQCMNTVASMAIQAEINGLLMEEKLYRAVEQGKPIDEVQELLDKNEKAWEAADVLSSEAYVMSYSLYKSDKNKSKKSNKALITPFELTAFAADDLNRSRFENDKQWAEYITEIYDHAKTNKVAYVAKLLKVDTQRAKEAIEKSQAIIKGEAISQAKKDTMILGALQVTKAAGKVAGVVATVASGGTLSGIMSVGGFVAGAADAAIEVVDTGLIITFGEDNYVTKKFEEGMEKVAPIIGIASMANLTSWEKGADIVGNLRFIADGKVEIDTKGTLFGINLKNGTTAFVDGRQWAGATPKQQKEIVKALEGMGTGVSKEALEEAVKTTVEEAKKAADATTPDTTKPSTTKPDTTQKPEKTESTEASISDLSDEKLDELIEETSLENTDWEQIFKELDEEFREHMEKKGLLPDDDSLWDYDPFMPFEDFPQDGDEDGDWDDPSKWSKPDMPFEEPEETATKKDDSKNDDGDLPVLKMLAGKYMGSELWRAKTNNPKEPYTQHVSENMGRDIDYKDGKLYWFGIELKYDPKTGTATGDNKNDKYEAEHVDLEFKEVNGELHLHFVNTTGGVTRTFDGVKVDDDIAKLEGKYAGSCKVLRYYPDRTETSEESTESVWVRINGNIVPIPSNFGHGQAFDKESIKWDKSKKEGSATADDGEYKVSWHFEELGGKIKLYLDVYDLALIKTTNMDSKYDCEYHYELVLSE